MGSCTVTDNKRLVFVALDDPSQQKNLALAQNLVRTVSAPNYGFKVNLDSVADFSPTAQNAYSFVSSITTFGRPVFVDLKMWNGGRTMEHIAKGCANLGVALINMYPHAGAHFVQQVRKALDGSTTQLFGLTVLTHYTDQDTQRLYGKTVRDSVRMFAEMNRDFGVDGIVVPGTHLDVVQDLSFLKLCPAIRPVEYEDRKDNNQEQTVTPQEAVARGADYLVVGSSFII